MTMDAPASVEVIGGGPAGCAAALAALGQGARVALFEKSRFPRHKVCGEFLSPEIGPLLEALGVGRRFQEAGPARITRAVLHAGGRVKRFPLPRPAFGLSRAALDGLLLEEALRRGAELHLERRRPEARAGSALVVAHGRATRQDAGRRLFGFKAHCADPRAPNTDGSVELYFFDGGYAGVSPVEGGAVNVCGLAPEEDLRACGFRPEELLPAPLRDLERRFDWLLTGPLVQRDSFHRREDAYLAGDALGFVDPFTGSGILAALLTGRLAGQAASGGLAFGDYYAQCRRMLRRQYRVASALRGMLGDGLWTRVALCLPGSLLYRLTRPRI